MEFDWEETADLVLISSTCFTTILMDEIAEKVRHMRLGTWAISLTKPLPTSTENYDPNACNFNRKEDWVLLKSINLKMSWGNAMVHIHKKISKHRKGDI